MTNQSPVRLWVRDLAAIDLTTKTPAQLGYLRRNLKAKLSQLIGDGEIEGEEAFYVETILDDIEAELSERKAWREVNQWAAPHDAEAGGKMVQPKPSLD
jgi:hypothetical protein